ncbi:MAG TPA: hypothetical protein VIJ06_08010 [Methylovirgula sp.]
MRYVLMIPIAIAMALTVSHASAAASSIKDCDKIQAADAYNLCLASFGPVAREPSLKPVPAGIGVGRAELRGHHRRHYAAHYRHHRHRHSRRMSLSITPRVVRR